jgi:hypothetical protein
MMMIFCIYLFTAIALMIPVINYNNTFTGNTIASHMHVSCPHIYGDTPLKISTVDIYVCGRD